MPETNPKSVMLIYLLFLLFVSSVFIENDFSNKYNMVIIGSDCLLFAILTAGGILYGLRAQNSLVKTTWRYAFPSSVVLLVDSIFIDKSYGKNRNANPVGIAGEIAMFLVVVLVLFPAYRAGFLLGYRDVNPGDARGGTHN